MEGGSLYSHPKGYFQPGVLALGASGRILYRWRGRPTRSNMGGATERPTAKHVFKNVSRALAESESPEGAADAPLDTKPELDSRGLPWPIFVSLLVANGWFVKAQPFPYIAGGPPVQRRARRAILRIPLFVAAWAIAFASLPAWVVGAALVAWAAWITPSVRFIGRQFQNLPGKD